MAPERRTAADEPLVSVVIPARDRAAVVPAAVASALPPGAPVEVVVVDDGSTDGTADAAGAVGDPRVRVIQVPPSGVCAARNAGVRVARGEWLLFLDSDDVLVAGWFANVSGYLRPGTGLLLASARTWNADRSRWDLDRPRGVAPDPQIGVGFLAGQALLRRDVFLAVGGYDETLRYSENVELAVRVGPALARRGLGVQRVDHVTVSYVPRSAQRGVAYLPAREQAALHMLRKHPQAFAASPDVAATYWRIIANARFVGGRRRSGLAALRQALRLSPRDRANWRSALVVGAKGVTGLGQQHRIAAARRVA